jgi:NDP-sugar pyrophosphorylase family protein
MLEAHLAGRVHLSLEADRALGTAGALAHARDWIDGRAVVVVNADAWTTARLDPLLDGWDGERQRVLVVARGVRPAIGPDMRIAGALLPWSAVSPLRPEPGGLWETTWRDAGDAVEAVGVDPGTPFVDCGTPAAYLAANLAASGGASVIGDGAEVAGEVVRSVVWPGAVVHRGERLVDAIRAAERVTVVVRP